MLLDQALAAVVGRVRLAGDRRSGPAARGAAAAAFSRSGSRSISVSRLYDGTAPGEADGEHVRVEHVVDPAQLGVAARRAAARTRAAAPRARRPAAARSGRRSSQMSRVGDLLDAVRPGPRPARWPHLAPARSRTSGATHVGACTPLVMEADRHLVGVEARPQPAEHAPADLAVQVG